MLGPMHSFADAVRRQWRRAVPSAAKPRRLVPILVSALVVAGTATGAVLATVGGKPAAVSAPAPGIPRTSPAPATITGPVVPMLGGSADGFGTPSAVPLARASAPASAPSRSAKPVPVAPLRGLKRAS